MHQRRKKHLGSYITYRGTVTWHNLEGDMFKSTATVTAKNEDEACDMLEDMAGIHQRDDVVSYWTEAWAIMQESRPA